MNIQPTDFNNVIHETGDLIQNMKKKAEDREENSSDSYSRSEGIFADENSSESDSSSESKKNWKVEYVSPESNELQYVRIILYLN